jgi:hypothetical protein
MNCDAEVAEFLETMDMLGQKLVRWSFNLWIAILWKFPI